MSRRVIVLRNVLKSWLVLATLSRFPTDADKERFAEHRKTCKDRQSAFNDTLWALINTREFILNH